MGFFSLSLSLCRTDPYRRRYTGALCGLGYVESNSSSLFPDHDIEMIFDTEMTQEDIIKVYFTL